MADVALTWQDKYKAYFLRLEAEKNQTQEILSQWKEKRDAEVAKIDADYLQNIGNVTTGRDQYKSWYDEALALDEERQAKFKTMVSSRRETCCAFCAMLLQMTHAHADCRHEGSRRQR
jgi:Skp family chaperone for outer membrane proteins